jgi:hypothetical protein
MNREDLKNLKTWFSDYVERFYTDNPKDRCPIRIKEKHTERVCENIIMLGKALGLSDREMILAETMGLFHDIGRFKQYAVYGTFNDMESENHAQLGLREMAKHNVLTVCTREEKRYITKAIAYHNAASMPEDEDEKTLFYIRLLRDADKLDIWKVLTDYYKERDKQPNSVLEIGLPDNPACSPQILTSIRRGRLARIQDLRTLNDFKLLQISWVYDLNFVPSFRMVKACEYIEQIEAALPYSKEITETVLHAHDYVNRHL